MHRFHQLSSAWPAFLILSLVALCDHYGGFSGADGWLLDSQFVLLRATHPKVVDSQVVVIAIDAPTLNESNTPLALWHPYYGRIFDWLATAKPRAVGLDIVLPEHGYEQRFPNTDRALMRGLKALGTAGIPVTVAHSIDENLKPKPLYGPFLSLVDPQYGVGSDVLELDADRVLRRHTEALGLFGATVPTFAGQIVRAVGVQYTPGLFNYRLIQNIPVISAGTLLKASSTRQQLKKRLKGRVVIIGSVLSDIDRMALPLPLLSNVAASRQPGVIVQSNYVSALLNHSLIPIPPLWPKLVLLALTLLIWPVATNACRSGMGLVLFVMAVYGLTLGLLMGNIYLPGAAVMASAALMTLTHLLIRTYQSQKLILIARTRIAAQKEFVNAISHDLRTPVGALLSTVDLVKKAKDERRRNRYLSWLGRAANVLEHEVTELLELSKMDEGSYRATEESLDLYEVVAELYASELSLAESKGLTLTLSVSAELDPLRYGSETAITRLLLNVLSNALKYSRRGCIALRVLPGGEDEQLVSFVIEDEAGGIPQDRIAHLFDKYQRFNADVPGIGLGMAIVRKLVDSLDGTIQIASREGLGTTIHITLPLKPGETPLDAKTLPLPPVTATTRETRVLHVLEKIGVDTEALVENQVESAILITDADAPTVSQFRTIQILSDPDAIWHFGQGAQVSKTVNVVTMRRLLYLAALDSRLMAQDQTETMMMRPVDIHHQPHVLLVDDNEIVRLAWSELLTIAGYSVTLASNGSETLEQVKQTRFDLIILDQNLPDMIGTTLAGVISRLDGISCDLQILLATSDPMTDCTALPTAITGKLSKSITPDDLLALVDERLQIDPGKQLGNISGESG